MDQRWPLIFKIEFPISKKLNPVLIKDLIALERKITSSKVGNFMVKIYIATYPRESTLT